MERSLSNPGSPARRPTRDASTEPRRASGSPPTAPPSTGGRSDARRPSGAPGPGDPPAAPPGGNPGRDAAVTLVSRSSFYVEPQTIFSLATGESVRYRGALEAVARSWGDPAVGLRTTVELDWRGCRGLGLVRGRKYEFDAVESLTFETAGPYPTSYAVRGRTSVRTQPGGACEARYVVTLRIEADAAVRLLAAEIRAIERSRPM